MILKVKEGHLNLSFSLNVDVYMVFASSENMRCFGCGPKCGAQLAQPAVAVAAGGAASEALQSFAAPAAVLARNQPWL